MYHGEVGHWLLPSIFLLLGIFYPTTTSTAANHRPTHATYTSTTATTPPSQVELHPGSIVSLQLEDTGGKFQEEFPAMAELSLRWGRSRRSRSSISSYPEPATGSCSCSAWTVKSLSRRWAGGPMGLLLFLSFFIKYQFSNNNYGGGYK